MLRAVGEQIAATLEHEQKEREADADVGGQQKMPLWKMGGEQARQKKKTIVQHMEW